jgi:ERCC4-type nuclease
MDMITVDTRENEKHPEIAVKLKSERIEVNVELLEYGDFFVRGLERNLIIERKSVLDLCHAVPHRLFTQVLGLVCVENAEPRLLIEGSLDEATHQTRWTRNSMLGVLVSVEEDFHIPIFTVPALSWVPNFLASVQHNIGTPKEKKFFSLQVKPRLRTKDDMSRCVIEGFKGVGPSTADLLLKAYGSVHGICAASAESLVDAVGNKKAAIIYDVIHHEYVGRK